MDRSTQRVLVTLLVASVILFGFALNPWITSAGQLWWLCYAIASTALIVWVPVEFVRAFRNEQRSLVAASELAARRADQRQWPSISCLIFLAIIILMWGFIFRDRLTHPQQLDDDAEMYAGAVDWPTTWQHLLIPFHEHVIVPCRLITYAVMQLSDDQSRHATAQIASIMLFLPCLLLLFALVYREWRSEFLALLAVALFALTTTYWEIVVWYTAASQWFIVLIILLACLLLAQSPENAATTRRIWCVGLLSLLAPFTFSAGAIVGPIVSLWIISRFQQGWPLRNWWMATVPTIGAIIGCGLVLPILLSHVQSETYEATGLPAFHFSFLVGLDYSIRSLVDILMLRNAGFVVAGADPMRYTIGICVIVGLFTMFLRKYPAGWRHFPAVAMIPLGYALTIFFRTWFSYGAFITISRYHLFAQLGVVILLTGAVASVSFRYSNAQYRRINLLETLVLFIICLVLCIQHDGLATDHRFKTSGSSIVNSEKS